MPWWLPSYDFSPRIYSNRSWSLERHGMSVFKSQPSDTRVRVRLSFSHALELGALVFVAVASAFLSLVVLCRHYMTSHSCPLSRAGKAPKMHSRLKLAIVALHHTDCGHEGIMYIVLSFWLKLWFPWLFLYVPVYRCAALSVHGGIVYLTRRSVAARQRQPFCDPLHHADCGLVGQIWSTNVL